VTAPSDLAALLAAAVDEGGRFRLTDLASGSARDVEVARADRDLVAFTWAGAPGARPGRLVLRLADLVVEPDLAVAPIRRRVGQTAPS